MSLYKTVYLVDEDGNRFDVTTTGGGVTVRTKDNLLIRREVWRDARRREWVVFGRYYHEVIDHRMTGRKAKEA